MTGAADARRRRRGGDGRVRPQPVDDGGRVRIETPAPATTCAPPATTSATATSSSLPGRALTAGHLGVLASVGVDRVRSSPRPRVGVLSTGDELVDGPRAAAAGPDPRLEPPPLLRAGRRQPDASRSISVSCPTTEAPSPPRSSGGRVVRRVPHQRRREHGRLRLGQGGARARRRHAVDADRHQAGQAVRVRDRRRRCRCSACPATRSRRWSPSSCSPARRCAR